MIPPPTTTTRARDGSSAPAPAEPAGPAGAAPSATGELAVGDTMRPGGLGAQPVDLVFLVRLEVSLEPEPGRAALPGQDVRGDPVQEPAVVASDDRAPGKLDQRVLQ